MSTTTRFDPAEYLDTAERRAAYIAAARETGDADFIRDALELAARAAKNSGSNRENDVTRR